MQSIERKFKKRITCNTVVAGAAILSIIVFLWFPAVDLWIAKWLYISSNTKPSMAYRLLNGTTANSCYTGATCF